LEASQTLTNKRFMIDNAVGVAMKLQVSSFISSQS